MPSIATGDRTRSAGAASTNFYNVVMVRTLIGVVTLTAVAAAASAQTPQPFPRPVAAPPQPPPSAAQAPPPAPTPAAPRPATTAPPPAAVADPNAPTAETLGFPVYPGAQFIASYDAGRGQRYYVFGSTAAYADLVAYYRAQLRDKGDQVFNEPPTHMFSIGRFRDETMAFPPGVTVKDWTWGGSQGYPNPKPGAQPARFPTIVMIVPPPAAPPAAAR